MLIKVSYRSGKMDVFDTTSFCATEPFKSKGDNLLTEFLLLFDGHTLETEGIMLEVYWYNPKLREDTVRSGPNNLPHAARMAGHRIRVASKNELEDVVAVSMDGDMLLWRQGDDLINGLKFHNQELLCYADAVTASINRRALALFDYLRRAHPELSEDEIADRIGYTRRAIEAISFEESANIEISEILTQLLSPGSQSREENANTEIDEEDGLPSEDPEEAYDFG